MLRGGSSGPGTPERGANATETRSSPVPKKLPGRVARPSAKMRETLVALEKGTEVARGGPSITVRGDGVDGRTTAGQRLLAAADETRQDMIAMMKCLALQAETNEKLCKEIRELKESQAKDWQAAKDELHATMEELRAAKDELKQELNKQSEATRNVVDDQQNTIRELKRQLKEIREQLDIIMRCPGMTASNQTSPHASYAQMARTPPTSQPSNVQTLSSMHTTPSAFTDTLFCTIDKSRTDDNESAKVTAGTVRSAVEKEVRATKDNAGWRCRAVTVDPKNTNRIRIACRDEEEQQMVKRVVETTKLASGVRVLRDELYPIKVDNVKRTAVLNDNGEIKAGATEALGQENETTVAKIMWLSKKDVPKAYGSMVIYLTKGLEAKRLLSEGFFHADGESGSTTVFERRFRPEQCYNCQQIGHKAFQCKNTQKCAKCAKERHHHNDCREEILKCVPCGGPHESFSRNCPKLFPTQRE